MPVSRQASQADQAGARLRAWTMIDPLAPDQACEPRAFAAMASGFFDADRQAKKHAAGFGELGLEPAAFACDERTVAACRERRRDIDRGALRAAGLKRGNDLQHGQRACAAGLDGISGFPHLGDVA